VFATAGLEIFYLLDTDNTPISIPRGYLAVIERMVGDQSVALPHRLNEFLSPSLEVLGVGIIAVSLFSACRSVVARRRVQSAYSERRTRDLVRMHGAGTLDYFALRHDKQAFFSGETVVTYGVYGGVCLVSPDPIGPECERGAAWTAFRRFADGNGWTVAVLGAGASWLSTYAMTGMRSIYVGDEAVVAVRNFTLQGGRHKSLRQAVNRISNYGYSVSFHDPATIDPALADDLRTLSGISRRGDVERGFSMTLGRMFHPEDDGLLLAVASDKTGKAVAFCQFVPSPSIGGYSLDVMRRDDGDHPNGLFDYLIVSTMHHLAAEGFDGLGLNFATMRAVLAGEAGSGVSVRLRRFLLSKLSRSMQIESLWRFNAKYDPAWIARYVVYGAAQELLPIAVAIVRAESLWDLPVIGKFFTPKHRRWSKITHLGDAA
jgi:lysyl-tRNA synthetase, class II